MKTVILFLIGGSLTLFSGCASQRAENPNTTRGAAIGAATGAVIGAIVGHQSGETGAGAALGAAVGGAAGGVYGNEKDRQAERTRAGGTAADVASAGAAYSSADYMRLMTTDEVDILRARAKNAGRSDAALTDFLTEEEKANLRRRDQARREIGR